MIYLDLFLAVKYIAAPKAVINAPHQILGWMLAKTVVVAGGAIS